MSLGGCCVGGLFDQHRLVAFGKHSIRSNTGHIANSRNLSVRKTGQECITFDRFCCLIWSGAWHVALPSKGHGIRGIRGVCSAPHAVDPEHGALVDGHV